jgi:hypothetical protein
MANPKTGAEVKAFLEVYKNVDLSTTFGPRLIDRLREQELPKLRPLWKRTLCAMRGHGGITPMPGDRFYSHEGLCKRCGSRVTVKTEPL